MVSPLWVWEEVEQVWIKTLEEASVIMEEIRHRDETEVARARLLYWDNYPGVAEMIKPQGCDFWRL